MKTKSMTNKFNSILLSITGVAFLTACSTTKPQVQTPEIASEFDAPQGQAQKEVTLDWWSQFHDPCLEQLLNMVADENLQLSEAAARISEARYLSDAESANKLPTVNASVVAARERLSKNGINGASVRNGLVDRTTNYYKGGLDASWEIDLFGENKSARESAFERMEASLYGYGALKNSLLAETALNYFRYYMVKNQLVAGREHLALSRERYSAIEAQVNAGVLTKSDLHVADTEVEERLTEIASCQLDEISALHALALLTGKSASEIESMLQQYSGSIPGGDLIPVAGLPLDLLKNRPDVLQAEALLKAEISNLGIREAALYPHISLVANVGQESLEIGDFADASSNLLSFGPSLYLPIFNGGQLKNLKKAQQAKVDQYQAKYQDTVIQAIREVEAALQRIDQVKQQLEIAEKVKANSLKRLNIAQSQYEAGVITKPELLSEKADFVSSNERVLTVSYNLGMEFVGLGKSLGKGWDVF
jgi:NodT family efflux transporter outer membrane factor (OMF) lipoprotein